jgi:hypothetical protein
VHMKRFLSFIILFSIVANAFASTPSSIEFFISNNTQVINLETAFQRLNGNPQSELKTNVMNILWLNHLKQIKAANVLGTYQMVDKNITGDNTEILYVSPQNNLSKRRVFALAGQMTRTLRQESVAVFIPRAEAAIENIIVTFKSKRPLIADVISTIHKKLPANYSAAFSLHLDDTHADFNQAGVTEVEWLGSKLSLKKIKKAFPEEKISYFHGNAFLIYQNGKQQEL